MAKLNIFVLFYWGFEAGLHGLWDLSSLTRDGTQALGSKSTKSQPLNHQGIPQNSIFWISQFSPNATQFQTKPQQLFPLELVKFVLKILASNKRNSTAKKIEEGGGRAEDRDSHFWIMWLKIRRLEQRRQWHPTPVLLPGKSHGRRSLVGCSPWDRRFTFTFHFHALEKEIATHSSILGWRIPGTAKPEFLVGCCLWGRTELDTTEPT